MIEKFLNDLKSKNMNVRYNAIWQLSRIEDEQRIKPLLHLARYDPIPMIRRAAIQSLWHSKDPWLVNELAGLIQYQESEMRPWIAMALIRIGTPQALDKLMAVLPLFNGEQQITIAKDLANSENVEGIKLLINGLASAEFNIRLMAAYGLRVYGKQESIKPLHQWLLQENTLNENDLYPVLRFLRSSRNYGSMFQDLALNASVSIAAKLINFIGSNRDLTFFDFLIDLLQKRPDKLIIIAVIHALMKLRLRDVFPIIFPLTKHPDRDIASLAYQSVKALNIPIPEELLDQNTDYLEHQIWEALDELSTKSIPTVIQDCLTHDDVRVRAWAIRTILSNKDSLHGKLIIPLLDDQHYWVRWTAATYLGLVGEIQAVAPLIAALYEQNVWVQQAACEALQKIGTPEAVEAVSRWKLEE